MAAVNYGDVLDQLRGAGLVVDGLEVGRLMRCRVEGDREKRGWYALHEITGKHGDTLMVGRFGVWHGNDPGTQQVELRKLDLSDEQRRAVRTRMTEDLKRAKRDRQAQAMRAAEAAARAWKACSPDGDCDYLSRKNVRAHGVRFSESGAMAVPMLDVAGRVHGLQIIRPKKRNGRDKEYWPAGVAKRGHFHLVGSPTWVVLVAEGYATAASLHEATGHPVAVAFDAGNLVPVAEALKGRYRTARVLICADDDDLVAHKGTKKEPGCGHRFRLTAAPKLCPECQQPHGLSNAGLNSASAAAMQVDGAWIRPMFEDPAAVLDQWVRAGHKRTDFNDLHVAEGLHQVRVQVEAHLLELGWRPATARRTTTTSGGGDDPLKPVDTLDEMLARFALVYGKNGMLFDREEHAVLSKSDAFDLCMYRHLPKTWMEQPERTIVRPREVGFDPGNEDPNITCNLWSGWPTTPKAGNCERLLELLSYMCKDESDKPDLLQWVTRWLAYPIQHPGAKMKSCIVVHGPQGAGKNLFFEAYMSIFGDYGRVIGQDAIEDKFTDWASRKLFLLADEVVARVDLYHLKNKLKSLITGDWISINSKNVARYDERNHVNLVFLSNEPMPVVLEEDDRRHCVIWTPSKAPPDFYAKVLAEIRDGGIAALHQHLLEVDLGDFHPGTPPPDSRAKDELIRLGLDSPLRFYEDVADGELKGITPTVGLSTDWYEVYRVWCGRNGHKPAPHPKFTNALVRKRHVVNLRKRYLDGQTTRGPHYVLCLGRYDPPEGGNEQDWLGERIDTFRAATRDYRGTA